MRSSSSSSSWPLLLSASIERSIRPVSAVLVVIEVMAAGMGVGCDLPLFEVALSVAFDDVMFVVPILAVVAVGCVCGTDVADTHPLTLELLLGEVPPPTTAPAAIICLSLKLMRGGRSVVLTVELLLATNAVTLLSISVRCRPL